MTQYIAQALSAVVVGVLVYLGTRKTVTVGAESSRDQLNQAALQSTVDQLQEEVAAYREEMRQMRAHVAALDAKLDTTTRLARKAVVFIDRVGLALSYDRPLPKPDGDLADAVDMSLWLSPEVTVNAEKEQL